MTNAGSMRGARETVAKALALECMRAAKAQERGCYVFAFAGPQEVRGGGGRGVRKSLPCCSLVCAVGAGLGHHRLLQSGTALMFVLSASLPFLSTHPCWPCLPSLPLRLFM